MSLDSIKLYAFLYNLSRDSYALLKTVLYFAQPRASYLPFALSFVSSSANQMLCCPIISKPGLIKGSINAPLSPKRAMPFECKFSQM